MATVVGVDQRLVRRTTCHNCASIIEFTPSETRKVEVRDYTGSTDIEHHLTCPKCSRILAVSI